MRSVVTWNSFVKLTSGREIWRPQFETYFSHFLTSESTVFATLTFTFLSYPTVPVSYPIVLLSYPIVRVSYQVFHLSYRINCLSGFAFIMYMYQVMRLSGFLFIMYRVLRLSGFAFLWTNKWRTQRSPTYVGLLNIADSYLP